MEALLYFTDGKTEGQKVLVDVMENTAMDFRNAAVGLFYNPKFVSNNTSKGQL